MKLELTRRYSFAASHRLASPRFSEAQNRQLYGKCAGPHGHGHNYVLEVTVTGAVHPITGMVANLADLDGFVQREVLDVFDHVYLNEQIEVFRPETGGCVPTTENLCLEIFRRLQSFPHARLCRVRLEETGRNSFEYAGEPGGRS